MVGRFDEVGKLISVIELERIWIDKQTEKKKRARKWFLLVFILIFVLIGSLFFKLFSLIIVSGMDVVWMLGICSIGAFVSSVFLSPSGGSNLEGKYQFFHEYQDSFYKQDKVVLNYEVINYKTKGNGLNLLLMNENREIAHHYVDFSNMLMKCEFDNVKQATKFIKVTRNEPFINEFLDDLPRRKEKFHIVRWEFS